MLGFKHLRVLNICKFSLIWQGSEYASGCNYGGVLNNPGLRVCQVSAYARVAQGSENALIWLNNAQWQGLECAWSTFYSVINKYLVLNMPVLRKCQGCEYAWIWLNNAQWQGCEYAWSMFHSVINKPPVLNIPVLRIWQDCEYARVKKGAE